MDISSYFNFRVYCERDYSTVKELLADFLHEHWWVIDHENRYERFNKQCHEFREREKSSLLFVAPARSLAEDYGDIIFRVENNVEKSLTEYNNLPINIRQRFSRYPST